MIFNTIIGPGRFYNIYALLASRSVISDGEPGVSEWCGGLTNIQYGQFANQQFSGNFTFTNVSSIRAYAFGSILTGTQNTPKVLSLAFPICSSFNDAAFVNNKDLRSITASSTSIIIATNVFSGCTNLVTVDMSGVTSIANKAFNSCTALTTANFPKCIYVNNEAFAGCTNLTTVSFSSTMAMVYGSAFRSCHKLLNISFPSCTSVYDWAFDHCSSLQTAYLPLCNYVAQYGFAYCSSLTTVTFSSGVSIQVSAFVNCSRLSSVVNLRYCSSLGAYAFNGCYSLSVVSLQSISSLQTGVFRSCYRLISLYLYSTAMVTYGANALASTPLSNYSTSAGQWGKIYVPASLYTTYITNTSWKTMSARIVSM